jgi:1,4-dihydroxy-2-naphthoate octaprenyltransferase
VGPERAVAQGWISPKAMLVGTLIALALACLSGLFLIFFGGWKLIFVGLAIALCVIAYSAGPYPLSYHGLGDVCVLLFYGIIPVCFTYFVQTLTFSLLTFLLSLAIGFLSVNILVVNNYRDCEEDMAAGKRTTIVLFGRRYGRIIYIVNAALAFIISLPLIINSPWWIMFLFGLLFAMIYFTIKELFLLDGKDLNRTLGHTARNLFFFAVLLSLFLLYDGGAFF